MKRQIEFWLMLLIFLVMLDSCAPDVEDDVSPPPTIENGILSPLPANIIHPVDNPSSPAKIELGRSLFWIPYYLEMKT